MAAGTYTQKSFGKGVVGPELWARDDTPLFLSALKDAVNGVVLPEGPTIRRAGTEDIEAIKDALNPPRAVPFVFREDFTQSYILEFGDLYMRVWAYGGLVEDPPGTPYEITTPWTLAQVQAMHFTQSNDVLYITVDGQKPRVLERRGATDWVISIYESDDGPYLTVIESRQDKDHSVTPSGGSGTITVSTNRANTFVATDVGRQIRIANTDGAKWGYGTITAFTDDQNVSVDLDRDIPATVGATTDWRLGAWGDTLGQPQRVSFYQSRLGFAGNTQKPQTTWLSVSGDFTNHAPTSEDDAGDLTNDVVASDAVVATINAGQVNPIQWLQEGDVLVTGTLGGVRVLTGEGDEQNLTPDNTRQKREASKGAAPEQPVEAEDGVYLYVGRYRRRIWELAYRLEKDGLVANNMMLLSERLTLPKIGRIAFAAEPHPMLWLLMEDGSIMSMGYDRSQETIALMPQQIAGTDVFVHSIAVLPGPKQDQLWLVVERTVNGAKSVRMERMTEWFEPKDPTDRAGAWFVDAGGKYEGTPQVTFSGFDHLEGETLAVWADGRRVPDVTVAGGGFSLDLPASTMIAGLKYKTRWDTLGVPGSAMGRPKDLMKVRTSKIAVSMIDTASLLVGSTSNDKPPVRLVGPPASGDTPPLENGTKGTTIESSFDFEGGVYFEVDGPEPAGIRGYAAAFEMNPAV